MACDNCSKRKHTCGSLKHNAYCTYVSMDVLPSWSDLKDEDCIVTYETTKELYSEIDKLKKSYEDIEDYDCLEPEKNDDGDVTQLELNKLFIEEICKLKEESSEDTSGNGGNSGSNGFSLCDLEYPDTDYGTCDGSKPKTVCEVLQYLINKVNNI